MAFIQTVRGIAPQIGEDCFLAVNATIVGDVVLGKGCSIWFNSVLRGDVNSIRIGNNVNIQDGSVGHNVTLHGCHIRDYALIGMGSVVMDDVVVGEGAIVAAGSVVLSKTIIEPYTLWAGVPAKLVKKVSPEQGRELNERIANNYQMYASWFDKEENP